MSPLEKVLPPFSQYPSSCRPSFDFDGYSIDDDDDFEDDYDDDGMYGYSDYDDSYHDAFDSWDDGYDYDDMFPYS